MFINNRKEYQARIKELQELERFDLLAPYRVTPEKLARRAQAWASLAEKAKRERQSA